MIKIYGTDSRVRMGIEAGATAILKELVEYFSTPESRHYSQRNLASKGLPNVAEFLNNNYENGSKVDKILEKFLGIYQDHDLKVDPLNGRIYDFIRGLAKSFRNDGKYLTAIELYEKLIDGALDVAECREKVAEREYFGKLPGMKWQLRKAAETHEIIAKARDKEGQYAASKIAFRDAGRCYEKAGDFQTASNMFGAAGDMARSLEIGEKADMAAKTNIFDPKTIELLVLSNPVNDLEIEASGIDRKTPKPKETPFRKVE